MGQHSIGEALKIFLERSNWKPKLTEYRLREEWPAIVGKTIAKYTRDITLVNKQLHVKCDVAVVKQELYYGKEQLIANINQYFQEKVVEDVIIK